MLRFLLHLLLHECSLLLGVLRIDGSWSGGWLPLACTTYPRARACAAFAPQCGDTSPPFGLVASVVGRRLVSHRLFAVSGVRSGVSSILPLAVGCHFPCLLSARKLVVDVYHKLPRCVVLRKVDCRCPASAECFRRGRVLRRADFVSAGYSSQ